MVHLRDVGITSEFIAEMAAAGYSGLTGEELERARAHGVSGEFAAGFQRLGYGRLSLAVLTKLRDHGVTPKFAEAQRRGGALVPLDELIARYDRGEHEE